MGLQRMLLKWFLAVKICREEEVDAIITMVVEKVEVSVVWILCS